MIPVNIDISHFLHYGVSDNITMNTQSIMNIQSIIKLPNLNYNPNQVLTLPTYNYSNSLNLHLHNISNQGKIFTLPDNFKLNTIPPEISNFKTSLSNYQQLHSYSKSECIRDCNSAIQYNNQIQCGIPDAITGLIAGEPDLSKCAIDIQNFKKECVNACNKLNQ